MGLSVNRWLYVATCFVCHNLCLVGLLEVLGTSWALGVLTSGGSFTLLDKAGGGHMYIEWKGKGRKGEGVNRLTIFKRGDYGSFKMMIKGLK